MEKIKKITRKKIKDNDISIQKPKMPKQVDVHYLKTNSYRTYYVDGIFGGLTPNGKIYMELFLQRQPTPQIIQQAVDQNGNLSNELKRVGKEGLVREIEAGLILDVTTAKVMVQWLESKIRDFEKQNLIPSKN